PATELRPDLSHLALVPVAHTNCDTPQGVEQLTEALDGLLARCQRAKELRHFAGDRE
ncbi:hypothetical protein KIPB_014957, partial [Kipferlia bialata]